MSRMLSTASKRKLRYRRACAASSATHPLRRLGPELHRRAVEAAERAVVLGAPPAAAGGLEREPDLRRVSACRAGRGALEVLGVVRRRQVVEPRGGGSGGAATVAPSPAGHPGHRAGSAPAASARSRPGNAASPSPMTAKSTHVDRADQLQAHLAVEVRAAEHRDDVRVALLQPARQRERRGVLLERRAEADDPRRRPTDTPSTSSSRYAGTSSVADAQQPVPDRPRNRAR